MGFNNFFRSIHLIRAVSVYLAGFVTYVGGSGTYFGVTRAVFNLYVLCGFKLIEGKYNNFEVFNKLEGMSHIFEGYRMTNPFLRADLARLDFWPKFSV